MTTQHDDLTTREYERLQKLIKSDPRWFWEAIAEHAHSELLLQWAMNPDERTHHAVGYMLRSLVADYCKDEIDRMRETERAESHAELLDHQHRLAG